MANERQWDAVGPVSLSANGSTEGVLQVTDTAGFYFGMQATLNNNASLQLTVYIKRVVNSTTLWVGATKGGQDHNLDLSAFTVATASTISAAMQNKSAVPMEARLQATYETDPVDAWRTALVDPYGNHYTPSNPLPTEFTGSISIGEVGIVGPAPDKNQLIVNADGSINVDEVPGTIPQDWTEIDLDYDSNNNLIEVQYFKDAVLEKTLNLSYDSNNNITKVVAT